jgi:hypothetical protein
VFNDNVHPTPSQYGILRTKFSYLLVIVVSTLAAYFILLWLLYCCHNWCQVKKQNKQKTANNSAQSIPNDPEQEQVIF